MARASTLPSACFSADEHCRIAGQLASPYRTSSRTGSAQDIFESIFLVATETQGAHLLHETDVIQGDAQPPTSSE